MKKPMIFPQNDEDNVDSIFYWRRKYNEAVDKWVKLDSLVLKMIRESDEKDRQIAFLKDAHDAKCGECGKSATDGWALFCVQCCEDSMVKAAVAEEREACALVCEQFDAENPYIGQGKACAFEIRERRNG